MGKNNRKNDNGSPTITYDEWVSELGIPKEETDPKWLTIDEIMKKTGGGRHVIMSRLKQADEKGILRTSYKRVASGRGSNLVKCYWIEK